MKGGKPLWTEFNENQLKNFLDKATSKKNFVYYWDIYLINQMSLKNINDIFYETFIRGEA